MTIGVSPAAGGVTKAVVVFCVDADRVVGSSGVLGVAVVSPWAGEVAEVTGASGTAAYAVPTGTATIAAPTRTNRSVEPTMADTVAAGCLNRMPGPGSVPT